MSIDMSQFRDAFFEESLEGLDAMESGLLELDVGEADVELINTIFRAAHSIKGGSGTFGFEAVAEFTHVLETLLDEMRDGRRQVTEEAVSLLLTSVDVLREMMIGIRDDDPADEERVHSVETQLKALYGSGADGAGEASASSEDSASEPAASSEKAAVAGWKIHFRPHEHLLKTGNDPVRMLDVLGSLGDLSVSLVSEVLPPLAELDPEESYLSWVMTLSGDVERTYIDEVFEWVEDDCELTIEALEAEAPAAESAAESAPAAVPEVAASTPSPKSAAAEPAKAAPTKKRKQGKPSSEATSIRVSIDKVDALINMVGELVITQSMLGQLGTEIDMSNVHRLRDGLAQLERNTRELQESVMRIRMLPISFAFNRFPRMVHDLSSRFGKKVELVMNGEQTELDKTVMEKIGDPLVHLVRNSLDHGLEPPEERLAAGKPETGRVHLNAYHKGGNIIIEVTDDGRGLNKARILQKARERGLIGENDTLAEGRILDLIFEPGFSTADAVSDVSGRGVGMDVVRRNIKELGGNIEVKSIAGKGTRFSIRLPLTLAILDGQLISVNDETYIISLISIVETLPIDMKNVNVVAGRNRLYKLRDEYIPIIRMHDLFSVPERSGERLTDDDGLIIVVEGDGEKAGLWVDDLLGQQQVVIKSLETNFRSVDGISGATILGDGTVALILDVPGVLALAHQDAGTSKWSNLAQQSMSPTAAA